MSSYSNKIASSKFIYHVIVISFDILLLSEGLSLQDNFIYA
jgi:hypothetical protein